MKLHLKILLAAVLVLTAALAAGTFYLEKTLRPQITAEVAGLLRSQMDFLSPLIEERSAQSGAPEDLQPLVSSLAQRGGIRITVVTTDGRVLADSSVHRTELAGLSPQLDRAEIAAALESGEGTAERHSESLDVNLFLSARRASLGGKAGVIRLAYPLTAVEAALGRTRRILATGALLGFLLAAALSFFLARWVSAPIQELARAARLVAAGDFSARPRTRAGGEAGELARSFEAMTGRLQETLGRLESEHAQAQRILSTVSEAIVLLGDSGAPVAGNNSFTQLFRAPPRPGEWDLEKILPEGVLPRALAALAGGTAYFDAEFALPAAGGARQIEMGAAPVIEGGRRAGTVLVFRDITRTRRLEQVRRDFVTNVSHELRTPLSAIQAAAETLSAEFSGDDPRARFAASILGNTRRLSALVGNLLELARLERPDFIPRREAGDLAAALAGCVENFRPRFAARATALSFEAVPLAQGAVFDPQLIDQLLSNLLENALQHTPAGGTVMVRCRDAGEFWRAEVLDSGSGIAPEHLSRVFERFYRVDKGRSREAGGTGLGLAIAKHIAERHGGQVGAENRPEGGARFWFTIPKGE